MTLVTTSKPLAIFLDDERIPSPELLKNYMVLVVTTKDEAIKCIEKYSEQIELISLDHDLGDETVVGNGYQVICWLEEQVLNEGMRLKALIHVHSANSGAKPKMIQAKDRINKHTEKFRAE